MANSDEVVVVSVGDTMLGDRASPTLRREGWDYPFRRLGELIGRGDLLASISTVLERTNIWEGQGRVKGIE